MLGTHGGGDDDVVLPLSLLQLDFLISAVSAASLKLCDMLSTLLPFPTCALFLFPQSCDAFNKVIVALARSVSLKQIARLLSRNEENQMCRRDSFRNRPIRGSDP